ncbi:MAG TPA: hypothetical protein VEU96_02655 [Bryobacteraceae bacterium]|nr:hypothetical protein [Bryobacteraceae bacterium]
MIRLVRRILDCCQHIFTLHECVVGQDLLDRGAGALELQNIADADPKPRECTDDRRTFRPRS